MKAETSFSLKDMMFNPQKVDYLADLFVEAWPAFPKEQFVELVVPAFPNLELKQRIDHIAVSLHAVLPPDYPAALDIVVRALPPKLDPSKTDDDFGDFILGPLSHFVALYGCSEAHLERSLAALREITMRFTAEDAIRFFINAFPERTMAFLQACATADNYHVRRLASEGTRPKLPWAQKLTIAHRLPIPILDALYADPTRYVTRSVANHLNDIAKIEPELVIELLARWQADGKQEAKEMAWMTRHSLRTLVKKGHMGALDLLGFGAEPQVNIVDFVTSTPVVPLGTAFEFSLNIESLAAQNLMVDYVMQFAGDGKPGGRKVFKLKQLELAEGQVVSIKKKHMMKLMTTRRLYAGIHTITLQLNGKPFGELSFELAA